MYQQLTALAVVLVSFITTSTGLYHVPLTRRRISSSPILSTEAGFKSSLRGKAFSSVVLKPDNTSINSYLATIQLDGQDIDVVIDTGSVNLLVPSIDCQSCFQGPQGTAAANVGIDISGFNLERAANTVPVLCSDAMCKGEQCTKEMLNVVKNSQCSPQNGVCQRVSEDKPGVCLFFDAYGLNASAAGILVNGPVNFAGTTVPTTTYGVIIKGSSTFGPLGIMGMGNGPGCNLFSCYPSFFDTMLAQGVVKENKFSICGNAENPVLVLGGSDEKLYTGGKLEYANLVEPWEYYTVGVEKLTIGEGRDVLPSSQNLKGFVDTGTSGLVMPQSVYEEFKTFLQSKFCDIPCMCTKDASSQPDCQGLTIFDAEENGYLVGLSNEQVMSLPTLYFSLQEGGPTIKVPPTQYFTEIKDVPGLNGTAYLLDIQSSNTVDLAGIPGFILGQPLVQDYYIEYDRANKRLGFATAVQDCVQALQS